MQKCPKVGIIAPSGIICLERFYKGIETLKGSGFEPVIHPQCRKRDFLFAGTDSERASALFQLAQDPKVDMIWCARGGYGSARMLPILQSLTKDHGKPPSKLLIGFSDVTLLHQFVTQRWGWHTLHAPMITADFKAMRSAQWKAVTELAKGVRSDIPWESSCLRFITAPPRRAVRAELSGGNLTVWTSLAGTPLQPDARGKILFFEEVNEKPYQIDRMFTQLRQAGMLNGAVAIILGEFSRCEDETPMCDGKPLRRKYSVSSALRHTLEPIGREFNIPIATGLPVGHEKGFSPLPLGAEYELSADGFLQLRRWDWLERTCC